jgi:hypothetical protein
VFATASTEQLEQIQDILSQLDHNAAAKKVDNRRNSARVTVRTTIGAILLAANNQTLVKIYSRDLSTAGIGFVTRRCCSAGEQFALPFDVRGMPPKLVLARITFCRYIRAGLYTVGAKFVEAIPNADRQNRVPEHWLPPVTVK